MNHTNNTNTMTNPDIPNHQASSTNRGPAPGDAALHSISGGDSPTATRPLPVDYRTICKHEAGHAVMRWLCGERARTIDANGHSSEPPDDKCACCFGTGLRMSAENSLLITLAGVAAETEYGVAGSVFGMAKADDIVEARAILREHRHLSGEFVDYMPDGKPYILKGDRLLEEWFDRACNKLRPYREMVNEIGSILEGRETMFPKAVAGTIRSLSRRYPQP
jgi:hypothetical protein